MDKDASRTRRPDARRKKQLKEPPDNDFGKVRDRRDFQPMEVSLKAILPNPHRDYSFSGLTGWRYYPTAQLEDRLGIGFEDGPSTEMVIPDSWKDADMVDDAAAEESFRDLIDSLKSMQVMKRQRVASPSPEPEMLGESSSDPDTKTNASLKCPPSSSSKTPVSTKSDAANFAISLTTADRSSRTNNTSLPSSTATMVSTSTSGSDKTASLSSSSQVNTKEVEVETTKTMSEKDIVPKAELYRFYGVKPRKVMLKPEDYLTWDNQKTTAALRYTSAFICPISKEVFLAGRYGSNFEKDGLICWYAKKLTAEHAAAARAWDCLRFRDQGPVIAQIGLDRPYRMQDAPVLPTNQIPAKINEFLKEIHEERKKMEAKGTMKTAVEQLLATEDDSSKNNNKGSHGRASGENHAAMNRRNSGSGQRGFDRNRKHRNHRGSVYTQGAHKTWNNNSGRHYSQRSYQTDRYGDYKTFRPYNTEYNEHENHYINLGRGNPRNGYGHSSKRGYNEPDFQQGLARGTLYNNLNLNQGAHRSNNAGSDGGWRSRQQNPCGQGDSGDGLPPSNRSRRDRSLDGTSRRLEDAYLSQSAQNPSSSNRDNDYSEEW